ncbi:MAG: peptidyl-prolyl cis-trans isomerase [Polyangiales bacterium]
MRRLARVAVAALALAGGAALAQAPPHTPVPTEDPEDDAPPVVEPDAGATAYNVVPLVDPHSPVARGRGVDLTLGELIARMQDVTGVVQERFVNDPNALPELVNRIVADRVLAAEARRRGLENDPLVRAAVERALVARLRTLVIHPAADAARPTDADVQRWYDEHPERFHIPERRRVRVIFSENQRHAQETLRLATLRRAQRYVHGFRRLAGERNVEPHLRSMAGDLRDVTLNPLPNTPAIDNALRAAAFEIVREDQVLPRLVEGEWHGRHGWFVVCLVGRRRAEERSLQAQADWIRLRIMAERRVAAERERVDALVRDAAVARSPVERMIRFDPAPPMDAGLDAAADAP